MENVIRTVCAYCKAAMGTKPGGGQSGVSHGICPACLARLNAELDALDAK